MTHTCVKTDIFNFIRFDKKPPFYPEHNFKEIQKMQNSQNIPRLSSQFIQKIVQEIRKAERRQPVVNMGGCAIAGDIAQLLQ